MIYNSELDKIKGNLYDCIFIINSLENNKLKKLMKNSLEPYIKNILKEIRKMGSMVEWNREEK